MTQIFSYQNWAAGDLLSGIRLKLCVRTVSEIYLRTAAISSDLPATVF